MSELIGKTISHYHVLEQIGQGGMGEVYLAEDSKLEGANVDHRADIWAVGAMLYEMVTGKLPFEGEYEQAVIYSIVNEEPEPLARYKTGVSPDLQRIVDKALDKDRETRYQGVTELLADLKRERKSSAISKKSISSARSRKLKRADGCCRCPCGRGWHVCVQTAIRAENTCDA